MEIKQVASYVNTAIEQATGQVALLKEDLSNIAEAEVTLTNANAWVSYLDALVNHIGRVIFVARAYQGELLKMLRDSWEFGSVLEKISTDIPEANNCDFMEPVNGAEYTENVFTKAVVRAKFFNGRIILEVTCPSITEDQLKQSFSNRGQLNSFVSMIFTACENAMQMKIEALCYALIRSAIVATIEKDYGVNAINSKSGVKAINLLYKYNDTFSQSLTKDNCLYDKGFLAYAGDEIRKTRKRLKKMSKLFNIEGRDRFTTEDLQHVVMWTDFVSATATYLEANTFNDELVKLPLYEEVPYWQGSGLDYDESGEVKAILGDYELDGGLNILGCIFDRDALVISNLERWTPTHYNQKMHFVNYWFQMMVGLIRDPQENFVVFFVA